MGLMANPHTSVPAARSSVNPPPRDPSPPLARHDGDRIAISSRHKEQRRRERRERRARRQQHGSHHLIEEVVPRRRGASSHIPDLLHSHVPPPYSTLPNRNRALPTPERSRWRAPRGTAAPAALTADLTRSHASFFEDNHAHHITHMDGSSHTSKSCCGVVLNQTVSIRWFILMIAFVGICCSVVGTILGALKASGREHLTVSLLMIGVGIVLITVSGIAWRLTSPEGPSCRSMLGLSSEADDDYNGRFLSRPAGGSGALPYGGRPQHPYAAMMYSDFQYRPPPPSYQASMQEYRLRLLLMDRSSNATSGSSQNHVTSAPSGGPISPPPNYYRSQNNSRMVFDSSQFSRPPSYRSHTSEHNLSAIQESNSSILLDSNGGTPNPHLISTTTNPIVHHRQNSSSSSTSASLTAAHPPELFIQKESKLLPLKAVHPQQSSNNNNLVTIVQTSESFALSNNNNNSLIVTVSGSLERPPIGGSPSREVEILAHL